MKNRFGMQLASFEEILTPQNISPLFWSYILKYISDRFEAKYQELVAEGDGFEEDKDEYTAENIFFVPENARWSVISAAAHTPEIGTVIDDAMRSIERKINDSRHPSQELCPP